MDKLSTAQIKALRKMQALEERLPGQHVFWAAEIGSLVSTLKALVRRGYLSWPPMNAAGGGGYRFALTDKGRRYLGVA